MGIAFDGTHLIKSCYNSNRLWLLSPLDASLVSTVDVAGVSGIGAMAWDGSRGKLWICNAANDHVELVDMVGATATDKFASQGCFDGLAYDGTDDTIWASADVASSIQHFQIDGTPINSFSLAGKLGGSGNSGIAVGGDNLYLANDGGSQIYQCTKDLATCTLMSTFARRLEDLECDNVTFAPKSAIWSVDAYDHILNAWEIPAGTCTFGGAAGGTPTPRPVVHTATPTASATPRATSTSLPTTSTPVPPTAVPPQPTATPPGGGAAGVITGPNTGSGPGEAQTRLGSLLLAVAMLSGGAVLSTAALRARRR